MLGSFGYVPPCATSPSMEPDWESRNLPESNCQSISWPARKDCPVMRTHGQTLSRARAFPLRLPLFGSIPQPESPLRASPRLGAHETGLFKVSRSLGLMNGPKLADVRLGFHLAHKKGATLHTPTAQPPQPPNPQPPNPLIPQPPNPPNAQPPNAPNPPNPPNPQPNSPTDSIPNSPTDSTEPKRVPVVQEALVLSASKTRLELGLADSGRRLASAQAEGGARGSGPAAGGVWGGGCGALRSESFDFAAIHTLSDLPRCSASSYNTHVSAGGLGIAVYGKKLVCTVGFAMTSSKLVHTGFAKTPAFKYKAPKSTFDKREKGQRCRGEMIQS